MGVLRDLFGEYGHTASADLLTSLGPARSNAGGARADLMALRGKRLVVMSEIDQRAKMQEAQLKALCSTDEISARGLYQNAVVTFRPTWMMHMLTNYQPRVDGQDMGFWRRLLMFPWEMRFGGDSGVKADPRLGEKLRKELAGILNWLLEGVRMYREEGLQQPEKVREATKAYRTESDVLGEWLDERCVLGNDAFVPTSAAWASWRSYSEMSGGAHDICDKGRLTRALTRRGIKCRMAVPHPGAKPVRCYFGLSLGEQDI